MDKLTAPAGAVIGIIGDADAGVPGVLAQIHSTHQFPYTLDQMDLFSRLVKLGEIEQQRRTGASIVLASHDAMLLGRIADEVWWVENDQIVAKGDPAEMLAKYESKVAKRLIDYSAQKRQPLAPAMRRGDGRAQILSLETLDSNNQATLTWIAGQQVSIRVKVRFEAAVDEPVIGIMIRTRIGFEVYGTNTELERVTVGPCKPGDERTVTFTFACELCPREYTITAASHDPDGIWHDWVEDAVAFTVADTRYTAGVANLHARISVT
jgi:lipopolysaccharide transport system ATP-binding protein